MNVVLRIPDEVATRITAAGGDPARTALEALLAEEYRAGRLTRPELRRALGLARVEVDGFLRARGIDESMTVEEFDRQQQRLDQLGL